MVSATRIVTAVGALAATHLTPSSVSGWLLPLGSNPTRSSMGNTSPTFLYLARNNNKCLEELGVPGGLNGVGIRFSVVQELVQKCNFS